MDSTDDRGLTAMHTAAFKGELGSVNTLIEGGGSVDKMCIVGWTPLLFAANSGSCNVMLVLLKRGADVNARSRNGTTPLHQVCHGQLEGIEATAKLLLDWGADETIEDSKQRTAVDMMDLQIDGEPRCSQEEAGRVRSLFLSWPVDKVWRRGCWLVMLRWRVQKIREARASGDSTAPASDDSGDAAESQGTTGGKMPRDESAEGVDSRARVRSIDAESVTEVADGRLSRMVSWFN